MYKKISVLTKIIHLAPKLYITILNSYLVKISTADLIKRVMSESKVSITLSVF